MLAMEQAGVVDFHECRTTGRRGNDVIEGSKEFVEVFGLGLCHSFESRIGHRLSAACLVEGIFHIHSQVLQQFVGCHAHLWIDGVDVARDKQSNFHILIF